jgi:lysophospholipase L1-like esterase
MNAHRPGPGIGKVRLTARHVGAIGLAWLLAAGLSLGPSRGQQAPAAGRWDRAIAAFESQDRVKPPPKNGIVFVGSSSIRFWDLPKSFPGLDVINRGFGGSELADSVHYAPRIVLPYEPRVVVLYAGDNDLAFGKSPERVAADFRAFVKVVHGKLPKTGIVFLSIKPSPLRWRLADKMKDANARIEAYCKTDEQLRYVDAATPLLDPDGRPRPELFAKDGLHLNAKGYERWAAVLKPILR